MGCDEVEGQGWCTANLMGLCNYYRFKGPTIIIENLKSPEYTIGTRSNA